MPIKSCSKGGRSGKKFGDSGKCFTGKQASAKAAKQGQAIKASQSKRPSKKGGY